MLFYVRLSFRLVPSLCSAVLVKSILVFENGRNRHVSVYIVRAFSGSSWLY